MAASQGLRHLPADGPVLVTTDEIPGPTFAFARGGYRGQAEGASRSRCRTARPPTWCSTPGAHSVRQLNHHPRARRPPHHRNAVGVGVFRDPPVYLEPGDRVRCEIDGIGMVENPIVDGPDTSGHVLALVKTAPGPGLSLRGARPAARHQRRPRPRPADGHLRHGPPHRRMGCLGRQDHPTAARRRARVRRRDRRGRINVDDFGPGDLVSGEGHVVCGGAATASRAAPPVRAAIGSGSVATAPSPSTSSCR